MFYPKPRNKDSHIKSKQIQYKKRSTTPVRYSVKDRLFPLTTQAIQETV